MRQNVPSGAMCVCGHEAYCHADRPEGENPGPCCVDVDEEIDPARPNCSCEGFTLAPAPHVQKPRT